MLSSVASGSGVPALSIALIPPYCSSQSNATPIASRTTARRRLINHPGGPHHRPPPPRPGGRGGRAHLPPQRTGHAPESLPAQKDPRAHLVRSGGDPGPPPRGPPQLVGEHPAHLGRP